MFKLADIIESAAQNDNGRWSIEARPSRVYPAYLEQLDLSRSVKNQAIAKGCFVRDCAAKYNGARIHIQNEPEFASALLAAGELSSSGRTPDTVTVAVYVEEQIEAGRKEVSKYRTTLLKLRAKEAM